MKTYLPFHQSYYEVGIVEINPEYFKERNKARIQHYRQNYEKLFETNRMDEKWNEICKTIKERDGKILKPEVLISWMPEEIFGIKGFMFWYLSTSLEFVCRSIYGDFQIIKIVPHYAPPIIQLMGINSGKIFLESEEPNFQQEFNKWIERNKLRFEVKN